MIVATIRALKMHGGVAKDDLKKENVAALEKGFANLSGTSTISGATTCR